MALENNRAPLLYYIKLCASFQIHRWIQTGITVRKCSIWVKIDNFFFVPCDLEIRQMTSKNIRAPLPCCFKPYVSFHSHQWIQTGVTVRKRPILVKIDNFFSRVTLKFNGWPSKTMGHLFYATSSFVHHFIPIGEFKFELQSGNAQFGSKSTICEPCDLEILRLTLKNNRASVLCYFKLCVSFRTNWCIQIWVTVRKRPIWVKFDDF